MTIPSPALTIISRLYVYETFPATMTLERVQGRRKFSKIFKIYSIHRLKVIKGLKEITLLTWAFLK